MKTYIVTFAYKFEIDEFDNEKDALEFAQELVHGAQMEEHDYDRIEIKEVK